MEELEDEIGGSGVAQMRKCGSRTGKEERLDRVGKVRMGRRIFKQTPVPPNDVDNHQEASSGMLDTSSFYIAKTLTETGVARTSGIG